MTDTKKPRKTRAKKTTDEKSITTVKPSQLSPIRKLDDVANGIEPNFHTEGKYVRPDLSDTEPLTGTLSGRITRKVLGVKVMQHSLQRHYGEQDTEDSIRVMTEAGWHIQHVAGDSRMLVIVYYKYG